MNFSYLDENVSRCRATIETTCRDVGRDPAEVTLMAAIKSADTDEINYIHEVLGVHHVGENRVQQLLSRYEALHKEGMTIHFIGTLQTNKVKYIIDKVDMIQSLDSKKLADEIEKQAAKVGRVMDVLIEINAGEEDAKSGVRPCDAEDLAMLVTGGKYPHLRLRGFMTMAPKCDSDEIYRMHFANVRAVSEDIWSRLPYAQENMILSMGMSDSFVPATMEGATLVRVGRSLFHKPDIETP